MTSDQTSGGPGRGSLQASESAVAAEHAALAAAVARRRNFAIISHPDAGKTTLTEKLLLYGGAIQQAGEIRGVDRQKACGSTDAGNYRNECRGLCDISNPSR